MFKKVRLFTPFILSAILTLTLLYNSCASQSFENIKLSKALSSFLQDFRVEIKNGSYSTKTLKDIPVNFKVPKKNLRGEAIDYEMKISQTPDCSGGEWESYQKATTWTFQSDEEEKLLFIYVKFREKEANYTSETKGFEETQGESECIYDSIVYDTKPPKNLKLSYKPAEKTNQKNAEFRFTAKDYSPIHFQCRLNKPGGLISQPNSEETLWTSCTSGISYDSSHFEEEGDYTFFLRARDLSGNTSKILEYTWTIDRTAPSLSFPSCPKDLNASASEPSSISVTSDNLNFPVSLYCKNDQEQFESCGTIESSQTPADIDSTYFIEEELTTNYYKKILNIKAIDTSGNFSEPIECIWHVDTGLPTVKFVTPTPEHSYGTSTNPYIHRNPFKIEVSDNSLQTDHTQSNAIEIEYKVYQCNESLPTCNQNQQKVLWRRLDINNSNTTEIISEGNPLKLKFHITQGLKPGINMANRHKIEIRVKDAVGNISNTPLPTATWDVYGQVEEIVSTQSTSRGKADILFVLDDSGSLSIIAQYLGNSISGITSSLSSLNWQIAVTSMERLNPSESREQRAKDDGFKGIKNFGHLVQLIDNSTDTFLTGQYILSSNPQTTCPAPSLYCSSNTSKLEDIFKRTIKIKRDQGYQPIGDNNFTFYGNSEYGIQSVNVLLDYYDNQGQTSATITELTDYTPPNTNEINAIQSFFREDSTFVVIFITDEQNCGQGTSITDCHNNAQTNINHPQNLIDKVKTIFGDNKKFISYPIIPKPGEGYPYPHPSGTTTTTTRYPEEDQDDYLKLAKAVQGREGKNSSNPVIWVDVDYNQSSRASRSDTTCPNTPLNRRVYTRDLCSISEDILRLTTRTIQLDCPPITENLEDTAGIHPPKYFYSPPTNPTSFTSLNKDSNGNVSIGNVQVTIDESWLSSSSSNDTNRVTLKVQSGDIPEGTYKAEYFCYSDQISPTSN